LGERPFERDDAGAARAQQRAVNIPQNKFFHGSPRKRAGKAACKGEGRRRHRHQPFAGQAWFSVFNHKAIVFSAEFVPTVDCSQILTIPPPKQGPRLGLDGEEHVA
jgi:hypothetical protein